MKSPLQLMRNVGGLGLMLAAECLQCLHVDPYATLPHFSLMNSARNEQAVYAGS